MRPKIMAIDPGEHIGIVIRAENGVVWGCTLEGEDRNRKLWRLLCDEQPDAVVYEIFALRQSAASKLVGNRFITCEVIGAIKTYCMVHSVSWGELQPMCKEYCGFSSNPKDAHYSNIQMLWGQRITEHTRDAYRLLRYFELFRQKEVFKDETR